MSSSFSDQPPPHSSHPEEGYTPTPPPPDRRGEDEDSGTKMRSLGSLAQKARGKQLTQVRRILFVVGALTILLNAIDIAMIRSTFRQAVEKEIQKQGGAGRVQVNQAVLQQEEDKAFLIGCAIDGFFVFIGILFIIFGVIIHRFPLPVTILSLALYLLANAIGIAIVAIFAEPEQLALAVGSGLIFRIIVIALLAKSIQSAYAFEKERRAEQEYGFSG